MTNRSAPDIIDDRNRDPARAAPADAGDDAVILQPEVPAALTFNGTSHAVMMVSPYDLEDFLTGFCLSEGIIDDASQVQIKSVRQTLRGYVLDADLDPICADRLSDRQRTLEGRSGCGLCGIQSLEALSLEATRKVTPGDMSQDVVLRAIDALPEFQKRNRDSGGLLHASAFANAGGDIILAREDIGRHNALDKVLGALARDTIATDGGFILMTSRCSYEIVTKTVQCGIGGLVTLSGPTLTAVNLARQAGLTLICRERRGRFRRFS
ncbi:formate dehydrogenase accessory sulfurtransferase FdhD [Thalassospira sp.]|uniref:formate dehydrogenase accessory sulfurtransferase FdhD n=1 Tax=Thalassospira sp. TaxID=1912094 RepID=UPI0027337666|nr:formate dehydrogenase accessory sulfurtransferase FdhD [Thalassospira sp.]MDP2699961.1 formate dehydrogenase accessory sulfurtransferase FdhD [Thalassospira sp.]